MTTPHDPPARPTDPQEAVTRPIQEDPDVTSDLADPSRPPGAPASADADAGFASQPSRDLFQPAGASEDATQPARDGEHLGRYHLLGSPDGRSDQPTFGGEGRVFRARPLAGGPEVALKTPLEKFADHPKRCARLLHEARQLRSMDHPAIVRVLDIDERHQPPYYTMTLLPGGSLSQKLKEDHPLATEEVLRLAIPLADAVRYVHETKGVSHRDIKPQNVMLDQHGNPVFVDFGLSRDNTGDEASIVDAAHDATSQRFKVGTLLYMAPELFEGKAGNSQTDIYAFGVMLYVMATGKRPYDGRDFESLSTQKRMHNPPEPLSVYPQLDARLAQIIGHATARRAKDRYATMEDLLEDLQGIRDGHAPIHAPRRRRTTAAAAPIEGDPARGSAFLDPTTTAGSTDAEPQRTAPAGGGWGKAWLAAALFILLTAGGYLLAFAPEHLEPARRFVAGLIPTPQDADEFGPVDGFGAAPPPVPPANLFESSPPATPASSTPGDSASSNPDTHASPTADAPTPADPAAAQVSIPTLSDPAPNPLVPESPVALVTGDASPDRPSDTTPRADPGSASVAASTATPRTASETALGNSEPASASDPAAGAADPSTGEPASARDAIASLQQQISHRLDADPALDSQAVAALDQLLQATADGSRATYRRPYLEWAHRAARVGAGESLAWLIQHAGEFDLPAELPLDSGHTWLQSAIRSAESQALAQRFPEWMVQHDIDPAILDATPLGTRSPRQLAESLDRAAWLDALQRAAKPAESTPQP